MALLTTRQEGSCVHSNTASKYKRKEIIPTSPAFQFNNVVWQESDVPLKLNDEGLSQWNLTENRPYCVSTAEVQWFVLNPIQADSKPTAFFFLLVISDRTLYSPNIKTLVHLKMGVRFQVNSGSFRLGVLMNRPHYWK